MSSTNPHSSWTVTDDKAGFHIRSVDTGDQAEWLRLRLLMWPDDSVPSHQESMTDTLQSPFQTAIVLVRPDGRLGGFVEGSMHPRAIGCETHHVGYVEGWFLEADLRGRGWGRRLIEAIEAWARGRGAQEMASDTQLENKVSHAAHLKLGYQDCGCFYHFRKPLPPQKK